VSDATIHKRIPHQASAYTQTNNTWFVARQWMHVIDLRMEYNAVEVVEEEQIASLSYVQAWHRSWLRAHELIKITDGPVFGKASASDIYAKGVVVT
jgi:hypothetical protein